MKISDVELGAEALAEGMGAGAKADDHTLLLDDLQHLVTREGKMYSEPRVARARSWGSSPGLSAR